MGIVMQLLITVRISEQHLAERIAGKERNKRAILNPNRYCLSIAPRSFPSFTKAIHFVEAVSEWRFSKSGSISAHTREKNGTGWLLTNPAQDVNRT
jgi:hypothetical protein